MGLWRGREGGSRGREGGREGGKCEVPIAMSVDPWLLIAIPDSLGLDNEPLLVCCLAVVRHVLPWVFIQ